MLDTVYPTVIPGPPKPSRIITPSNLLQVPGRERYEVAGAGALLIPLGAGDRITITNAEGGQVCELVAADGKGATDAGIIGLAANSSAEGLKALLVSGGSGLGGLRLGMERRGIDLGKAKAVTMFGAATPAGTAETVTAARDGVLIIAAPGKPMLPDAQDTATPLVVEVQRSTLKTVGQFDLPDPLADPVLDLRVKSATAQAYFVKAGDYIQILDVDGRQCTDFQCFSARKLDKGIEHALDVTTSRTLDGPCLFDARPAREIL